MDFEITFEFEQASSITERLSACNASIALQAARGRTNASGVTQPVVVTRVRVIPLTNPHADAWPSACHRCGADLKGEATTMSTFSTETICMECKARERQHPAYATAAEIERQAVLAGNTNFPGVGISQISDLYERTVKCQ